MVVPLHRIRYSWGPRSHIEIEWNKGRGVPLSLPLAIPGAVFAEAEVEPDDTTALGIPALCWREDTPVLFERFQLRENTEYFIDITLPIGRAEAEAAYSKYRGWPFKERLAAVFKADPPRRWRENVDGSITVSGQLRLRNHAGILDLSASDEMSLRAEVVCRKINYFDEFRTLLDDVASELTELLLQHDSPISASFNFAEVSPETEAAILFQLRYIMADGNLPVALDELRRSLHSLLQEQRGLRDVREVEEPNIDAFLEEMDTSTLVRGGPLARLFRGYTPSELPVLELRDTIDSPENRYVKSFLEELRLLMRRLAATLAKSKRQASLHEVEDWILRLDDELGSGIWRQIGPMRSFPSSSQVLQKRQGYKEILKFDSALKMSLELPWKRAGDLADGLLGDIRPVNELYEYWCFFLLRRTLAELCEAELPQEGSLISVRDGGLRVQLEKGRRSRVTFLYRQSGSRSLRVSLFYNRRFPRPKSNRAGWYGSYTARFDPDYSLEIKLKDDGQMQRHWLHFDAKYRLENADLGELFDELADETEGSEEGDDADYEAELIRVHKKDDLFKMHTYRDGILSTRGAYILFPGSGTTVRLEAPHQSLFVRHPSAFGSAPEYLIPGVGAFDLCPGRDAAQRPLISGFIERVLKDIFKGMPYADEHGLFP